MESMPQSLARRAGLPLILIAAVIQGCALYALHRAIDAHHWPATNLAWLIALYAVAFLVPTTVQLMVEYAERSALWVLTALLAGAVFYFGRHYGGVVADADGKNFGYYGELFWNFVPSALVLLVWWLLTLPFLQSRVATSRWSVDYERLFAFAWRNVITLAEAALFTGLFWLILSLWQSLFHMLGIDFFRTLFDEPIFAYPVTAIVFGCALHLIGSIDGLVSAVLEQLLNVLKWLATVAGALLVLFTLALLTKLPGLVFSGRHAIGAEWLLWLVAVIVLFLNAAYRDGKVDRPYPRWIAHAFRFAVPLTIVIAGTALYALIVRSSHFGLTVERVWGFVVAGAALVYSVGYSIAAFRRGPWLSMASRVNVIAAISLVVVIGAALTPVLSPYHLAAISQYHRILDGRYASQPNESPFIYLAFESGKYGREELERLRTLNGPPGAAQIRDLAARALKQRYAWQIPSSAGDTQAIVAKLPLYPAGRTLDPELARVLAADWSGLRPWAGPENVVRLAAGVFVDLNGDGADEFVILSRSEGSLYQNRGGHWVYVGALYPEEVTTPWPVILKALSGGDFAAVVPAWKDLSVGAHLYRMAPQRSGHVLVNVPQ
ncbi:MAG TPA: hypothetical protein VHY36_13145 [Steroidobacteraceae bacterium]|jgi:hypothetical protein|nr:hypothetical protein [Steroidobacteraceae bacterium]